MSIDFPRAWEIAASVAWEYHHNECSFNVSRGGVLCDCDVIYKHPEYVDKINFYGAGGVLIQQEGNGLTTSRPRVKRYDDKGCPEQICRVDTMYESDDGDYVLYEDYEELQAECEELRIALAESQANDRQAMYYLNQMRRIVGGYDFPDMVERCRELVK